jgi:hypothetical protein
MEGQGRLAGHTMGLGLDTLPTCAHRGRAGRAAAVGGLIRPLPPAEAGSALPAGTGSGAQEAEGTRPPCRRARAVCRSPDRVAFGISTFEERPQVRRYAMAPRARARAHGTGFSRSGYPSTTMGSAARPKGRFAPRSGPAWDSRLRTDLARRRGCGGRRGDHHRDGDQQLRPPYAASADRGGPPPAKRSASPFRAPWGPSGSTIRAWKGVQGRLYPSSR